MACDATIVPVVTGQVDWAVLDELSDVLLQSCRGVPRERLHDLVLQHAVSLLSGPAGLAGQLRRQALVTPATGTASRWGWTLTLHPDATTTATHPDGRTLGGNSPPRWAA